MSIYSYGSRLQRLSWINHISWLLVNALVLRNDQFFNLSNVYLTIPTPWSLLDLKVYQF